MTAPTKTSAFQPSRYIWKGPALSEARSLPANCYTSEAFFKAEVENIRARGWIIVGRVDEWPIRASTDRSRQWVDRP
jgi:hypothetical protein